MKDYIRFGGAQIPCTNNLDKNIEIIKAAIDWAAENSVDYLVTPEGSLSGYFPWWDNNNGKTFQDVKIALEEIVNHTREKKVGLCLGTMWAETNFGEYVKENQIRFFDCDGNFLGKVNKTYTIPEYDQTVPNTHVDSILLPFQDKNIAALGLICNDFWGGPADGKYPLPLIARSLESNIIIHSTNGFRGEDKDYDDLMNAWHEGNLRMYSWATNIPIITVDNCYYMQGDNYNGDTSSQSGVLINGKWMTSVPRQGTQYFHYDFNTEDFFGKLYKYHSTLIKQMIELIDLNKR